MLARSMLDRSMLDRSTSDLWVRTVWSFDENERQRLKLSRNDWVKVELRQEKLDRWSSGGRPQKHSECLTSWFCSDLLSVWTNNMWTMFNQTLGQKNPHHCWRPGGTTRDQSWGLQTTQDFRIIWSDFFHIYDQTIDPLNPSATILIIDRSVFLVRLWLWSNSWLINSH